MVRMFVGGIMCLLLLAVSLSGEAAGPDFLSHEEQVWLRAHDGKIRVAPDPHYPPVEFFDEAGRFVGIAADYLRLIEEKLGIRFEIVRLGDFEDILTKARQREIDMVNTVIQTPARSEFLLFTRPYISIPNVIVVANGGSARLTSEDLGEMTDVVYQAGYSVGPYLMEEHGLTRLQPVLDPAQALRDLSMGRIQAMVGNLAVISHYVRNMNLPNLRIAGDVDFNDVISFAARSDWPMLHQILDKTLLEISAEEREAITEAWIGLKFPEHRFDHRYWYGLLAVLAMFLLALAVLSVWNRTLKKQVALKVAEHRLAEEALAEEAFRRHLLIEQSHDGIVVLDENGKVHEANRRFAGMLGYSMDDCEQLHVWDWDMRWSREELLDMVRRVDSAGDHFETRLRRRDGTVLDVEISSNGAVIKGEKYVFCVCRDITQRKRAEIEIMQKNVELEKALAEKDRFFSIIAHDLKSPLSGFLATSRLMAENLDDLSREEVLNVSSAMHQSAENLFNLLENLLEWAQLQRGLIGFAPRSCSLSAIITRAKGPVLGIARQKGVTLESTVPGDMIVHADEHMLDTVLRNLLSNAVKFSRRGGRVMIAAKQEEAAIRVSVQDHGIGMDQETLEHIFSLGLKTSQTGTAGEQGTGLGLVLCKEFIEHHGGRIWAESMPGQGTTFFLTLPVLRPDQA